MHPHGIVFHGLSRGVMQVAQQRLETAASMLANGSRCVRCTLRMVLRH